MSKKTTYSVILLTLIILLSVSILQAQTQKCAYCGKKISGTYIEYNHRYYHPDCYQKIAPKCAYCGEIISGPYVEHEGKKYHKTCYIEHIADKCAVCGEPITDHYRYDLWGNKFHPHHENEYSRCDYCQRLMCEQITGGGREYPDGRKICNLCYKEAIFKGNQLQTIVKDVQNYLALKGIKIDLSGVPIELVDKKKLAELSATPEPKELGFTKYDFYSLGGKKKKRKNTVYILEGIPRRLFEGVLAHEMMHVWMNLNCEKSLSPELSEGAANYAAYLLYYRRNDDWADFLLANLMEDPDPCYGVGFRRVKAYNDQYGVMNLLNYLKTHTNLP